MQVNLPITPNEYVLADGETLVSTTDTQGRITHCNQAFVRASGFDYDELLGQPHSLVRHPDMPPEAFKDMWSTIGRGRPWSGLVKNRRKNGDFYWVHANVTPVMERGKPKSYMSVRLKPSREQIRDAEALYTRIAVERGTGRAEIRLHAGNVRPNGWLDLLGRVHRLTLAQRACIGLAVMLGLTLLPALLIVGLTASAVWQALAGLVGMGLFMAWFVRSVSAPLAQADQLAGEVAGCDLEGSIKYDTTSPLGSLMRRLWLVNLNMRAIVADVRAEVAGMTHATEDIHRGSQQLSARTEAQAAGVEETSASLEQIAGTVQHTADTARELAGLSTEATGVAGEGGEAVERAAECMQRIQSASQRINDIIEVMEGLAFQTNLLALNAAVEASHAGDHGRGFGVVAAEVRALAHRSTDAAHQIRELIRASGEEVAQGTAAVDGAAQTIRRAVNSVRQVADRLSQITNATHEQSLGAAQISQAMQLLDDVTQQNSALAHQASRNCEALESRAGTLQRAVQIFTMKG